MNIGDRVQAIVSLIGGRTDKNAQISEWLAAGYRDIATTYPMETLETTADTVCVANAANNPTPFDTIDYPADARAIKAITIGVPPSLPGAWQPLRKRNVAIIDRYATNSPGVPAIWAPYAAKIVLRPVPNDAYPIRLRYWKTVVIDTTDINRTELLVPDDWIEIIDYEAQMRACIDLNEFDKAGAIRTLLYGDPRNRKKQPGLISQRLTRIQAEYENANYGLRPKLQRYTFTS